MKSPAALLWMLWMAPALCSAQTLVIDLYDYSDLSAKEIVRLTETAGVALGHAGIHIVWRNCHGALASETRTTCDEGMRANEIAVRLQPVGPGNSNDERTLHLGRASVNAKSGEQAIVFVAAVRAQAAEFGVPFTLILGYVVAHEAGHCLLGPGHSYAGLMRSRWNGRDAGDMSQLSLNLTKQEARKAVARVTRLTGSAEISSTGPDLR